VELDGLGSNELAVNLRGEDTSVKRRIIISITSGILFALPLYAMAQPSRLITFEAGRAALASEVNDNFLLVAGSDTGRIFIAPKEIDTTLTATDGEVDVGPLSSFTAAFGRPTDYVPGVDPDITIRPLFSGCGNTDADVSVVSTFFNSNIGANADNTVEQLNVIIPMPAETTPLTIEAPNFTRMGLGDVNYVTITRNNTPQDTCPGNLSLHGIIIEYPR
jgi:hypothetical protein